MVKSLKLKQLIAAGILSVAVAACGGGGGTTPGSSSGGGSTSPSGSSSATSAGSTATSGSTGTSGATGGSSGMTGGSSGMSGTSGMSGGSSMTPGVSGTSGASSTPGVSGMSGASSTPGMSGMSGISGISGMSGGSSVSGTGANIPAPNLPAGYKLFRSKALPYVIGYPKGWTVTPAKGGSSAGGLDTFKTTKNGHIAVINITSESVPSFISAKSYLRLSEKNLTSLAKGKIKDFGKAKVDGTTAYLITYNVKSSNSLVLVQALWVKDGRGWVETLATQKQDRGKYVKVMKQMLSTFRTK